MSRASSPTRAPEQTRRKILEAAFGEFYAHGFQGGSLNHVVDAAGTTKGALFHHFEGKHELGYAVLDEMIGPLLLQRWLAPVADSLDPLSDMRDAFRRFVDEDIASGNLVNGCPLNNLAQEMSPLDDGFHRRINELYDLWRARFAAALVRGQEHGTVRRDVDVHDAAALIVASQMGIWGSGKSSRSERVMRLATAGLCRYLDSLRP
jgi:TetR/AcrR family transcriptional repressor of nem operon